MPRKLSLLLPLVLMAVNDAALAVDPKLDPGTAPAPTFKTLDQIPPTWDQLLPGSRRFRVVFTGAVLDRETGLVWERTPSAAPYAALLASEACVKNVVGPDKVPQSADPSPYRYGWHLPTVQELASLIHFGGDITDPALPPGHPFVLGTQRMFWASTASSTTAGAHWVVQFSGIGAPILVRADSAGAYAWCVRGTGGAAAQ